MNFLSEHRLGRDESRAEYVRRGLQELVGQAHDRSAPLGQAVQARDHTGHGCGAIVGGGGDARSSETLVAGGKVGTLDECRRDCTAGADVRAETDFLGRLPESVDDRRNDESDR